MNKKGDFIISSILFLIAIGLGVVGVLLFNVVPLDVIELTARQSLIVVGIIFAFLFAIVSLGLAIGFLVAGLNERW